MIVAEREAQSGSSRRPRGAGGRVKVRTEEDSPWRLPEGSGLGSVVAAFVWAWVILAPLLLIGGWVIYAEWRAREDDRLAMLEVGHAYERLISAAPESMLPLDSAVRGRDLFVTMCIACHGPHGEGVVGLGLNLVESDFVASLSDDHLHRFLITGRPNALPVAMPPRGGAEELSDSDLRDVVVFLRGLQDPRRMPHLPAMVIAGPTEDQKAAALDVAGGDPELAAYIASGDKLFHATCVACHGKRGVGVQGNGKALARNEFISGQDDDSLLAFLKRGRAPSDPANTTGIQMPPKGGNPALSEDDLLDIIAYLRTLQGDGARAASGE